MIVGIDPGLTGAIVFLSPAGDNMSFDIMPNVGGVLDLQECCRILGYAEGEKCHAFLEKVGAAPGQGVSSMFKFGRVYGQIEGVLAAMEIPYTLVTPQRWQRDIHKGIDKKLKPKDRSRIAASRLFPGFDLRPSDRCRVPHSGVVDALLIAEYGRRQVEG